MQIWPCHFSAQKLLLPTAYRLESKLIKMEVNALENLALTHLLASFLNVIFPSPSCFLHSLCDPLHMQTSYLEFPAVRRVSVASNRKLSSNHLQQWNLHIGSQIKKSRGGQDWYLVELMTHCIINGLLSCHLPAFCSVIYFNIWEAHLGVTA